MDKNTTGIVVLMLVALAGLTITFSYEAPDDFCKGFQYSYGDLPEYGFFGSKSVPACPPHNAYDSHFKGSIAGAVEQMELTDDLLREIAKGIRAAEPRFFRGYRCTDDCSGHEAGYNWAVQNRLSRARQCGGKSRSFIEGCLSYFN